MVVTARHRRARRPQVWTRRVVMVGARRARAGGGRSGGAGVGGCLYITHDRPFTFASVPPPPKTPHPTLADSLSAPCRRLPLSRRHLGRAELVAQRRALGEREQVERCRRQQHLLVPGAHQPLGRGAAYDRGPARWRHARTPQGRPVCAGTCAGARKEVEEE